MVALRVHRFGMTLVSTATPALRVHRFGMTLVAAVALDPLPTQVVEPGTLVTIKAVPTGGGTLSGYTWRVISGGVTLLGTGDTRTFIAPSVMPTTPTDPGLPVVVGVTGTDGTTTSPERQTTITVRKQLSWTRVPGGSWVGGS